MDDARLAGVLHRHRRDFAQLSRSVTSAAVSNQHSAVKKLMGLNADELHHRLVSFVPWPARRLERSLLLAQAIAEHFALELQLKSSGKFLGGLCAGSRGRCRSLETFHGSCYVDSLGSPTRVDLHLLAHVRSEVSHGA